MAAGRSGEALCGFSLEKGPRQLMRAGIALIFVGHINFILGAIVHGTVLRHVANPEKRVSPEYCTANVISVVSGLLESLPPVVAAIFLGLPDLRLVSRAPNFPRPSLLTVLFYLLVAHCLACLGHPSTPFTTLSGYTRMMPAGLGIILSITTGICAILASRNLANVKLHWTLLAFSLLNALLSAACFVGLILSISLTIANGGKNLISGCNATVLPADTRSVIMSNECPFDTTRIYETTLALWFPSMFLSAVEAALSIRFCIVAFILRGIGPCGENYLREKLQEEEAEREKLEDVGRLETHQLIAARA